MRPLHYIEIENFKTFRRKQRIELDHPTVLIGPNNCGKTSVIQAIALWSQAIKTWQDTKATSKARERTGAALNRLSIVNVPVQRTRFLWHQTKVRNGKEDVPLVITVGVFFEGDVRPVPMRFRNQGDDLVYCTPDESVRDDAALMAHAAAINVDLLYPMSGLEVEEPVLQPGRIGVLLGQGQTAQVLRNLCLMVHRDSPKDWDRISNWMKRLFQVKLGVPLENTRGAIDLTYSQGGVKEPLALSAAGRGFQQMLLMFAYLFSHKRSVLLVDEPDAHLEILRQRQVFVLLKEIAAENGSQAVLATHSEVILDTALDSNLTLLLDGRAENLARKTDIHESLKLFGAAHYVRARQCEYVLYLEGSTDVEILRAFAAKLRHHVEDRLDRNLNVFFVENIHHEPSLESEIDRVEGGFGIEPKDHFNGLRKLIPGLTGLAILDNDGRNRPDTRDRDFTVLRWQRYEIENYFITPELLLRYSEGAGAPRAEAREAMDSTIRRRIFASSASDYSVWAKSDLDARRLIWEAKTATVKLSAFAEEYFRLLAEKTKSPVLLSKGEFYRLVDLMEPESIADEIDEKLNRISVLL